MDINKRSNVFCTQITSQFEVYQQHLVAGVQFNVEIAAASDLPGNELGTTQNRHCMPVGGF
jgi:hypothetical protein